MRYFRFASPLFIYLSFFGFFIIGEYVFRLSQGDVRRGSDLWLHDLLISNAVLFGIIIVWETYRSGAVGSKSRHLKVSAEFTPEIAAKIKKNVLAAAAILVMIGVAGVGNPFANPLGFRQAIQGGGAAYFLVYFIFMEKVYGAYYFNQLYLRKATWAETALAAFIIIFSLSTGFASLFIHFLMYGMIFISARYGARIVGVGVVLLFAGLVILTPIYTLVRENLAFGGGDLSTIFQLFWDRVGSNLLNVLYDRFDYFDLQIAGSTVARIHSDFTLIFNAFAQVVPRGLWPGKPPTYSLLMTKLYAPELLDIGVSINFGYVNEFTLYFGEFGPYAAGAFFGVLVCYCHEKLRPGRRSAEVLFYALVIHGYMSAFIGGGFIGDLPFAQLVIALLIYKLLGLSKGISDRPWNGLRPPPHGSRKGIASIFTRVHSS